MEIAKRVARECLTVHNASLSNCAWAVLHQLHVQEAVEDGDIISKEGRKELIERGLAIRVRGHRGLAVSNLTKAGRHLAVRYQHDGGGHA